MKKLLVVIDMQNDFIDGALGSQEAQKITPNVIAKIRNWDGDVWYTMDTHNADSYLESKEGQKLPVLHCIEGTRGWQVQSDVSKALSKKKAKCVQKHTFGEVNLPGMIYVHGFDYVELVGLCTDICVVSNAITIKSTLEFADIAVDAECCAGTTPEMHEAALKVMKSCQIEVLNRAR